MSKNYFYSRQTGNCYILGVHADIPADAIHISAERFDAVIANPAPGKVRSHDAEGLPILIDPPPYIPTAAELCAQVDAAADAARHKVAGDPLRAVEYDRAALEAQQYQAAGFTGEVPLMVAAWVTPARDAEAAAREILAEAGAYIAALTLLRTTRLQAKEQIRALMDADQIGQAQALAEQTVAAINAAVAGVGNANG